MSIRLAASVVVAAMLCACGGPKSASTGSEPAASPQAVGQTPARPANSPVSRAGQPGAIPLDAVQHRLLDTTVAKAPPALRPRLRYAIATRDDGKPRLVVYDGEGLGASGRHPRKPNEYIIFRVLNASNGEHYDPQQNSIIAPIPPPPQRDTSPIR